MNDLGWTLDARPPCGMCCEEIYDVGIVMWGRLSDAALSTVGDKSSGCGGIAKGGGNCAVSVGEMMSMEWDEG